MSEIMPDYLNGWKLSTNAEVVSATNFILNTERSKGMRILVRMVNDRGELINDQPETMILPTSVEDRGIETVYRFEVECHELNKKAYCKYYKGQEELEMEEEGEEDDGKGL